MLHPSSALLCFSGWLLFHLIHCFGSARFADSLVYCEVQQSAKVIIVVVIIIIIFNRVE